MLRWPYLQMVIHNSCQCPERMKSHVIVTEDNQRCADTTVAGCLPSSQQEMLSYLVVNENIVVIFNLSKFTHTPELYPCAQLEKCRLGE